MHRSYQGRILMTIGLITICLILSSITFGVDGSAIVAQNATITLRPTATNVSVTPFSPIAPPKNSDTELYFPLIFR